MNWIIDEFQGSQAGLLLAEVEFKEGEVLSPKDFSLWLGQKFTRQ